MLLKTFQKVLETSTRTWTSQNQNTKIKHCLRYASVITRSCLDSKTILNWLCNSKILWNSGHLGWKTWSKARWNPTRVDQVFLRPPGNFFWNGAFIGKSLVIRKYHTAGSGLKNLQLNGNKRFDSKIGCQFWIIPLDPSPLRWVHVLPDRAPGGRGHWRRSYCCYFRRHSECSQIVLIYLLYKLSCNRSKTHCTTV